MFPSNIAGLPTWYTIRASKHGYIGRKKEVDFLVAMNPETAKEDVLTLEPGAAVVYDEPLKLNALRSDLVFYPVPFDKLVAPVCPDAKLRRLVRNMIYDGILAQAARHRPGADGEGARQAARQEGEGGRAQRRRRSRPGWDYAEANLTKQDPFVRRADERDGRQDPHRGQRRRRDRLHDGRRHRRRLVSDHALVVAVRVAHRLHEEVPHRQDDGEGDVRDRAGRGRDRVARHGHRRELGGRAVDDADGGPGHLAHGASSPASAYYAETPAVIFDVQRVGPSTGLPTRTAQGDLLQTAFLSHGDTKHIMLMPALGGGVLHDGAWRRSTSPSASRRRSS